MSLGVQMGLNIAKQKMLIAKCFDRAARHYNQASEVQKIAGNELFCLFKQNKAIQTILDIGAGTGHFAQQLQSTYPQAQLHLIDLAPKMLELAQHKNPHSHCIHADFDDIPIAKHSAELIFANMTLQWSFNLADTLKHLSSFLKPDGQLVFSLPIEGSFEALTRSLKNIDPELQPNNFINTLKLSNVLHQMPLKDIHIKTKNINLQFDSCLDALKSIKNSGATYLKHHHQRKLLTRTGLKRLEYYYNNFKKNNKIPLNYHLAFVSATI